MIGPTLLKAIAAAQADARPLNKSELGGTQQPRHPADPQERWVARRRPRSRDAG